jgi:hypothetical protein
MSEIDKELQRFIDEKGPFTSEADALSKFFRWYWIEGKGVRTATAEDLQALAEEEPWLKHQ